MESGKEHLFLWNIFSILDKNQLELIVKQHIYVALISQVNLSMLVINYISHRSKLHYPWYPAPAFVGLCWGKSVILFQWSGINNIQPIYINHPIIKQIGKIKAFHPNNWKVSFCFLRKTVIVLNVELKEASWLMSSSSALLIITLLKFKIKTLIIYKIYVLLKKYFFLACQITVFVIDTYIYS